LNALNFRNTAKLNVSGDIRINGEKVYTIETLASLSGYVQQEDLFFGNLKVKEHLQFQAMLRMDKNTSKEERTFRVEEALNYVKDILPNFYVFTIFLSEFYFFFSLV